MAYIRKRGKTWRAEIELRGVRDSESFGSHGVADTFVLIFLKTDTANHSMLPVLLLLHGVRTLITSHK